MWNALGALAVVGLLAACGHDGSAEPVSAAMPFEPVRQGFAGSEWSEPVNLGPPISVPFVNDANPTFSPDGLSLYYDSERTDLPGAQGALDTWVSRRACTDVLNPERACRRRSTWGQ